MSKKTPPAFRRRNSVPAENTDSPLKKRMKKLLATRTLDLALLLASIACFVAFGVRATFSEKSHLIRVPLATLTEGTANKRVPGQLTLSPLALQAELYDLDVIWVPAGRSADLLMDGKFKLHLSEKTFALLRQPFNGNARPRDKIIALSGKIEIKDGTQTDILTNENGFSQIRPVDTKKEAAQGTNRSVPAANTLIFSRNRGTGTVKFEWAEPLTGFLVVSGKGSSQPIFRPLNAQTAEIVPLATESTYRWQLLTSDGKPVTQAIPFQLQEYSESRIQEALKSKDEKRKVIVLME